MPDHIIELSVSARRTIFDAMKEYYQKELNLVDYSVRLGNLISFEHTIQVSVTLCYLIVLSLSSDLSHSVY